MLRTVLRVLMAVAAVSLPSTAAVASVLLPLSEGPAAPPAAATPAFLNVRDFGAVGDGKTDDTVRVRSSIHCIYTLEWAAARAASTLFLNLHTAGSRPLLMSLQVAIQAAIDVLAYEGVTRGTERPGILVFPSGTYCIRCSPSIYCMMNSSQVSLAPGYQFPSHSLHAALSRHPTAPHVGVERKMQTDPGRAFQTSQSDPQLKLTRQPSDGLGMVRTLREIRSEINRSTIRSPSISRAGLLPPSQQGAKLRHEQPLVPSAGLDRPARR